jgi:hypothetical protein
MTVVKVPEGKMTIDEMSIDKIIIFQMPVDKMPEEKMTIDEMPVDRMIIYEMSVDKKTIDNIIKLITSSVCRQNDGS